MAADDRARIFLYGTLRRGGSRDVQVFYPGADFVAPARVRGRLFDLEAYPGLRLDSSGEWVQGELFDVTAAALAGLDEWEGIDLADPEAGEYRRVRVDAMREDGTIERCWVYEVRVEICVGRPVIASGDWLRR
ncbi:MAG TPA: gamma-glutamylcyclotransferase family protein [Chthoniobacterales bacterium]